MALLAPLATCGPHRIKPDEPCREGRTKTGQNRPIGPSRANAPPQMGPKWAPKAKRDPTFIIPLSLKLMHTDPNQIPVQDEHGSRIALSLLAAK